MKQIYLLVALLPWLIVGCNQSETDNSVISTMESIELESESFWNGSDQTGGFESGLCFFNNSYNADWYSWSGWAVSNTTDITTAGYDNQYSAITGQGFDPNGSGGSNYAVSCPFGQSTLSFSNGMKHQVTGFYVTNSTYATLSMENGDAFAKKFGGEDGSDADWFKLTIKGLDSDTETGTVDFYLADFRFENNALDYIIKTWTWVDLTSLGEVTSLEFSLTSSDNGDWGMNTPGYFCADNFEVEAANSDN